MEKQKKQNLFFAVFLIVALVIVNLFNCKNSHECTSISLSKLTTVAYCNAEELSDSTKTKDPIIKSPLPGEGILTEEEILELLRRTN